jgi:hypothetical protein
LSFPLGEDDGVSPIAGAITIDIPKTAVAIIAKNLIGISLPGDGNIPPVL